MANMTEGDLNLLKVWLSLDGKPGPAVGNPKNGERVRISKDFVGECYLHGANLLLVVPSLCYSLGNHPHLFGYALNNPGVLRCRYFWTSASEGCWRVGTGTDDEAARNPFRFKKGKSESLGYIFETQVSGELNAFLDKIFATIPPKKLPTGKMSFVAAPRNKDLHEFFCDGSGGVFAEYSKEIDYDNVLDAGVFGVATSAVGEKRGTSYQKSPDLFKRDLKPLKDLWETLARCLDHKCGGYEYFSALLNLDVVVERYKLQTTPGCLVIEIAYTRKGVSMTFKSKDLASQKTITAPICWVKTVYFEGQYSTFGNFTRFPRDLAFLPQKPMDYDTMSSKQVAQSVMDRQGDRYGSQNQYVSLALYDEKYCPLIRAFKKMKGMPMFQAFSKKASTAALQSLQDLFRNRTGELFTVIQATMQECCDGYLNEDGTSVQDNRRIAAFRKAVSQSKSLDDLGQTTFDLLARSKVGRELFSDPIETGPPSYLVSFSDALRTGGLIPVDLALNLPGLKVDWKATEWEGEKKSIVRGILYLWNEGLFHHFTEHDKLEGLLQAITWAPTSGPGALQSLKDLLQTPIKAEGLFNSLQAAVIQSCERYLKGPQHGEHGIKRVTAFRTAVSACGSLDELGQAAHDLFIKNKVGKESFWSLFGGNINTNPSSYIVYFCDALLMGGLAAIDSAIDLPGLTVDWKSPEWRGENKSLLRAILYIRNQGLFQHFESREELEGVLKAMA